MRRKNLLSEDQLTWARTKLDMISRDFDFMNNPKREDALRQSELQLAKVAELWDEHLRGNQSAQLRARYVVAQSDFYDTLDMLEKWMKQIDRKRMNGRPIVTPFAFHFE